MEQRPRSSPGTVVLNDDVFLQPGGVQNLEFGVGAAGLAGVEGRGSQRIGIGAIACSLDMVSSSVLRH